MGAFFPSLLSSTTGKCEADPVYVCSNLKRTSRYAVVIKEKFGAVYPEEEQQSSKSESAPWALQAD